MIRGVVKYRPVEDCPQPNYPTGSATPPVTKPGVPNPPPTPPESAGTSPENSFIDQAALAAIRFSNMKVVYYKMDLLNTKPNLYGEAIEKWYLPPVEIRCLIERGTVANTDTEYGVDVNQTLTVTIPKLSSIEANFIPESGDIIMDVERYYEVNSVDRHVVTIPGSGNSVATIGTPAQVVLFVVTAHLTRTSKLNLVKYN